MLGVILIRPNLFYKNLQLQALISDRACQQNADCRDDVKLGRRRENSERSRRPPKKSTWHLNLVHCGISVYLIWVIQAAQVAPILASHQTRLKKKNKNTNIHQESSEQVPQIKRHRFLHIQYISIYFNIFQHIMISGDQVTSPFINPAPGVFPAFTAWRFRLDALGL